MALVISYVMLIWNFVIIDCVLFWGNVTECGTFDSLVSSPRSPAHVLLHCAHGSRSFH
jgi:hypothetical protein